MSIDQTFDHPAGDRDDSGAELLGTAEDSRRAAPLLPARMELPDDALILVPVKNLVLFPGLVLPVSIGRPVSVAAAQAAVKADRPVGLLLQKDPAVERPGPDDLTRVGTIAKILRYVTTPDGTHHMVAQGEKRFRVTEFLGGFPFLAARVKPVEDDVEDAAQAGTETEARFVRLKQLAQEAFELLPQAPQELLGAVQGISEPGSLADMVAGLMDVKAPEKQAVLEAFDAGARLDAVIAMLNHRVEVLRLTKAMDDKARAQLDERQKKYILREQMSAIRKELGEEADEVAELDDLKKAVEAAGMPAEARAEADKQLKRLARTQEASGEHAMIRAWLEWMTELPWTDPRAEVIDIAEARRILDEDHHGLEKIKKRILEFLAVRKLNPAGHSPILCFVGPPGVGKTSLGQSIARALGRRFVRAALGGLHDEAEIRGHRRTYIGALPGVIIQSMKKAGTRGAVMMLDEIDKIGTGFHGDPNAALLEVLDPAQNATFRDNYLGVPFDLSKVVFIATANSLDSIPGPLRDRMEIIQLPGYTQEEKLVIARQHLLRRQIAENGLNDGQFAISDAAITALIADYTREAGVRNLERVLGAVARRAAVRIAEGEAGPVTIDAADLEGILGPQKFESEVALRAGLPGVATGLAWTPVGGDILFIEASRMPGSGRLVLTGQLGEVMKESAQAALTLVKSRAAALGIDAAAFEKTDVHVHVPAGAVPKDGPSAGVAMFTALCSLFLDRAVAANTAMTGEISLRGLVLPVGGIKEKVLAALRAGVTRVMLPARNRKDLEDVPAGAREKLEFVFLENVDQVLAMVLDAVRPEPSLDDPSVPDA